jgi:hypothetical protein
MAALSHPLESILASNGFAIFANPRNQCVCFCPHLSALFPIFWTAQNLEKIKHLEK